MSRTPTERDLRIPEFRDAKLEDLEFRGDGRIVRKDRWETGIRRIVSILGMAGSDFEIDDVVAKVRALDEQVPVTECHVDDEGYCSHRKCPHRADDEPGTLIRPCPLPRPLQEG